MLVECSYRGTECSHPRNWKTIFTRYGKCYTFNNPDNVEDIKMTLKTNAAAIFVLPLT